AKDRRGGRNHYRHARAGDGVRLVRRAGQAPGGRAAGRGGGVGQGLGVGAGVARLHAGGHAGAAGVARYLPGLLRLAAAGDHRHRPCGTRPRSCAAASNV
ncbi:MAG: hypothetical protein AVDCRST_MAG77-575, partial [uncultured Chloroflexi bacterium]